MSCCREQTLALPYLSNLRKDYRDFFWNTYNESYGEKSWKIRFVFSIAWKLRWLSINICLAFAFKEGKPFNIFLWCSESKHNSDKLVHGNRKLRRARKQHPQGKEKKKKRMLLSGLLLFYFYCCRKQVTYCSQVGLGLK